MRVLGQRKLRDGRVVQIHANNGLRKMCDCSRRNWPKCSHAWHFSFSWRGNSYRRSLDRFDGKPVESKTDAERIADELRRDIRNGRPPSDAVSKPELGGTRAAIVPAEAKNLRQAGKSWHTKRGYQLVASRDNEYRLKRFCDFVLPGTDPPVTAGEKLVQNISTSDIEAFRHHRRSKGLSAVTTNHDLKLLRKMFAWFVREGLIVETPFRFRGEAVIKLDRETPRSRRFATGTDEDTLLGVAEPLLHDVIVAMLDTCCRPGEALKLRWQDVDFLRREVVIRPENAKTREGRRVPLTIRLEAILKRRRIGPDGETLGPSKFVFGDATGAAVKSVREKWARARDKAGLGDLQLRDLRHEAASRYEESGMPTTYVSKMLGHRSLATTTRYLNPTIAHLHKVIQQIEENRQKAAALAKSLQSGSTPEQNPGPPADGDHADKSLVS